MLFQRSALDLIQRFPSRELGDGSPFPLGFERLDKMRFRAPFQAAEADPFCGAFHHVRARHLVCVAELAELIEPFAV